MIAEPVHGERDLWRIWATRKLPATLHTRDGRSLQVLFPGLANTGPGPDFTGALLAFASGEAQRGDVEIHLKSSSWAGHKHHLDPHYINVILHVVLLDDGEPARTVLDALVPVLALGPLLAAPVETSAHQAGEGPCLHPDAPRPSPDHVRDITHSAGLARFEQRAILWEGEFAARSAADCMLHGLLRAMGLGRNAAPYAALAAALNGDTFEALLVGVEEQRRVIATGVLLGMAGLLEQAGADEETRLAWTVHSQYWPGRPLDQRQWQRFRLRPSNLPEARLRVLAAMLANHGLRGFLEHLAALLETDPPPTTAALLAPLLPKGAGAGRSWALEAWTNVLLPLLSGFAAATGRSALADSALQRYKQLPGGGENRVLDRMVTIAGLTALPHLAIEQQGLLHIWSAHCEQQRCDTCPLPVR